MSESPSTNKENGYYKTYRRLCKIAKKIVGRKLTEDEREFIISIKYPCRSFMENLTLDFLGQFTREEEVTEK